MKLEGYDVYVSTRKNKKYDVYKDGKYITSFGQKGMEHYRDTALGHYSHLDHNDKQRLANFKSRFKKLIAKKDKKSAMYWSDKYLW